jgi:mannose-6-phosphate isomerase-like protein (cupin superfamily)
MDPFQVNRRALLLTLGGFGFSRFASKPIVSAQASSRDVLGPNEGEHLVHFRDSGAIDIKGSPATGWSDFAIGTQQVKVGTGIPIHRHFEMNESFYVLEGEGTVVLDDVRHSFAKGSTIFIPKMTWHGFENPDRELLLLWVVTPAGLDSFFRATCSPPGAPAKGLSPEQIREIALKYGTEFR